MNQTQPATLLPLMIRLTAIGYLLFFIPNLLLAATHHIHTLPAFVARLFDWGGSADATAVMLSTVYVVWAIFLFHSARAPLAHRLFLDFNLTANAAHFVAMLLMALTMPEEHRHAAGRTRSRTDLDGPTGGMLVACAARRRAEPRNRLQRRLLADRA